MPFDRNSQIAGRKTPVSCPGVEDKAYVRLSIDAGDAVQEVNLGTPEVSDATVLSVTSPVLNVEAIQEPDGTIVAIGEAAIFELTVTKPGGYELPSEEYVIVPYTTDDGDQRRAKKVFILQDAFEYGGHIVASIFVAAGTSFGWAASEFGFGANAFGFGA